MSRNTKELIQDLRAWISGPASQNPENAEYVEMIDQAANALDADEPLIHFAEWRATKQAEFHACTTGDCPHMYQRECAASLVEEFRADQAAGLA